MPTSSTTISPGSTSRTNVAPTTSRLAVSDDRHQPGSASAPNSPSFGPPGGRSAAGRRPRTRGRKPWGSRTPMTRSRSQDDEAERAANARQHLAERLDRVLGRLVGQQGREQLRVCRGREPGATAGQLGQQLARVDQVAVVADGDRPARSLAIRRLGVLPDRGPGRAVAAVGDGQPAAQAGQVPLVEDRADHAQVLVEHQLLAVAHGDAGQFLATMLEREQAERRDGGCLRGLRAGDDRTEHAAHQA